ncbi:hypothetical protein MY1884_009022, partial [Beauveria asiatica]
MADILGAATAASAALGQRINLIGRIREAVERHKELPALIEKYSVEVSRIKAIVELVRDEEALKTPNVGDAIIRIRAVSEVLSCHLGKTATTKGPVHGFFKQLVSGQQLQERLERIMSDLGDSKQDLCLSLQLVSVGLTRGLGDAIQVNISTVNSVDKLLERTLGSGHDLRISRLLKGHTNGTVTLTQGDITALAEQQTMSSPLDERG